MLQHLYYLLKYALFWLFFFILSRLFFLIYNLPFSSELPVNEWLMVFAKGIKLDLSMMGYVSFFASLILGFTFLLRNKLIKQLFAIYTLIFLVLFSIITFVDAELYRNWGFRMDSTIFLYLSTPKEALASSNIGVVVFLLFLTFLWIVFFFFCYKKWIAVSIDKFKTKIMWLPVFGILMAALFFLPIRGGVGIAPINTGAVYFSTNNFANHSAVNVHWQFGQSLSDMNKKHTLSFMSDSVAKSLVSSLYQPVRDTMQTFCKTKKPNVIILILESFSSRMLAPLGGMKGVTPCLNKLSEKGILFNHFFANGDRSDKGIVAILSGYPSQPKTSIIKNSTKTEKLPFLSRKMNENGYHTSFYYGGDINFANMRQYLVNAQFDELIYLKDFDAKYRNSKWGIHDHIVFERFYKDCNEAEVPFFKVFFTLSSHEPFDVPHKSQFDLDSEEQKFLNAAHYTDSCVGSFVAKAEQQAWWENTLVVIVADHSGRHPDNVNYAARTKFEIPMLLLGGALTSKDTLIQSYCNQTDIPKMIGRTLHKNFEEFVFSKNELSANQSFAFYVFNNGFAYFTDSSGFIFDNDAKKIMQQEYKLTSEIEKQGKAFMQVLLNDYNSK